MQHNRYNKTYQAAVIADAVRKRQRCNQRDPPIFVSSYTYHMIIVPLPRVHFLPIYKEEISWIS